MGLSEMELPDLEKLFDEKLSSIKLQIGYINSRIDSQVTTTKYIIGGLVFPLILLIVSAIAGKLF